MPRRIVIDLYDHTTNMEILDILRELKRIGIDDARLEGDKSPLTIQSMYTTAAAELGRDRVLLPCVSENDIVVAAIEMVHGHCSEETWIGLGERHFEEIIRAHDEARKVADNNAEAS